jgi:preprotein translocase subunit SecY
MTFFAMDWPYSWHDSTGSFVYLSIYSLMILFFSYFWVATQFNEMQIADDLKKNGGYIPGVRPGQGTSDYLHKAMSRITLAGAIFPDHHRRHSDHFVRQWGFPTTWRSFSAARAF